MIRGAWRATVHGVKKNWTERLTHLDIDSTQGAGRVKVKAEVRVMPPRASDTGDAHQTTKAPRVSPTALTAPGLQRWEVINFCGLSLPVCGLWSQLSQCTNAVPRPEKQFQSLDSSLWASDWSPALISLLDPLIEQVLSLPSASPQPHIVDFAPK